MYLITCIHADGLNTTIWGDSLTLLLRAVKNDTACVRAVIQVHEAGTYRPANETDFNKFKRAS